jgi:hypothetical protein
MLRILSIIADLCPCTALMLFYGHIREYWMIYRRPGFFRSYDSAPSPPPPSPLSCQQLVSLSQSSCVSLIELTDGKVGRGGGGSK